VGDPGDAVSAARFRTPEIAMLLGEPTGQTWLQLGELGLAFVLSALIGLEREIRQKSAGLRTYTLVGFSSALIILISKYGFTDVLEANRIVVDPSRIAAQIVSGIGFIGGGVIFVRKDIVRGLTTAATVWLTSAVGMACGAGLPILAIAVAAGHFVVIGLFPAIERRLPKSRWTPTPLRISYWDGRGILREILAVCTQHEFAVNRVRVEGDSPDERSGFQTAKAGGKQFDDRAAAEGASEASRPQKGVVTLLLDVSGARSISKLTTRLSEIDGVVGVQSGEGPLTE
jgi:putative Mg2+ transporter-C (MgtC) family protein